MDHETTITPARDKTLFTPGPLTTSRSVKQAMLRDLGSRDYDFIGLVRDIRRRLVWLGGGDADRYTAVIVQGSGTFGLESVVGSVVPRDGRLLVVQNGAYGRRIAQMAAVAGVDHRVIAFAENEIAEPERIADALASDTAISHVAIVHCETTSGLINPVERIGALVQSAGRVYVVDAMSSFGAIPLDLGAAGIDFLISSANKCIEGVPGFSFVLADRAKLGATRGQARSLSLDLCAQWDELERSGQFRFTPPTHALLAFHQALLELEAEGGIAARAARYAANRAALVSGMRELDFEEYLRPELQSPIITSFRYPRHSRFVFEDFYARLNARGYVIYPGKVGNADCFRIGTIGRLFPTDLRDLLAAIAATLVEIGVADSTLD